MELGKISKVAVQWRRFWPHVASALVQTVGLAGFTAFLYGVWQIHRPTTWIIGGALVVLWTILKVRST